MEVTFIEDISHNYIFIFIYIFYNYYNYKKLYFKYYIFILRENKNIFSKYINVFLIRFFLLN